MIETHLKIFGKDFGLFGVSSDYSPVALEALLTPLILRLRQNALAVPVPSNSVSVDVPGLDIADQLQKLANLKNAGVLDDEEFSAAKAKLLNKH